MDMNNQARLLDLARAAATRAYAPYSKFRVGAAVLSSAGNFYSGCNVENISFPVGSCAEENALAAMVCGGDTDIAEILVYAESKTLISPCGACRQRIAEFATKKTLIHLADVTGIRKTLTINELLPHSFAEF